MRVVHAAMYTLMSLNPGAQPAQQCGTYRMRPNYPNQYWPGMFSNDMLEGTFNYASSAAMCGYLCATTPGCKGVSYTARFGWCWYVD